ncbi:hypothetical protein [Paraburkholderia graminis]|uniref:hypothetical protein n=1 Tax=Paraburkholderia graminis TaxID=60548 RepID=UPI0038B731E4
MNQNTEDHDAHLFEIEKFVRDIEKGFKGGFVEVVDRYGRVKDVRELYLGKRYYRLLNNWLERYSEGYCYSARIEVFYDVCKGLGLLHPDPFPIGEPVDFDCAGGTRYIDLFDALIERIRARCQSREFTEQERQRSVSAERNQQNVLAMDEAMFEAKGRWLILYLTLGIKEELRHLITPEIIQKYRARFFAARRFNKLFSGIKNYAWSLEQGMKAGLHLHVILYYSGEHNHDAFIARQMGEYWVNVVTDGKGTYWNSNASDLKPGYEKRHGIGVGQINYDDGEKRKALRINLLYLAKAEQYLMIKSSERTRTFDMGRVPKKRKAGRPRAESGRRSSEIDGVAQVVGVSTHVMQAELPATRINPSTSSQRPD